MRASRNEVAYHAAQTAFVAGSAALVLFFFAAKEKQLDAWADAYFLILTVQWFGATFAIIAAGTLPATRRVQEGVWTSRPLIAFSSAFVAMGLVDGILGREMQCEGSCDWLLFPYLLLLGWLVLAERVAIGLARGRFLGNVAAHLRFGSATAATALWGTLGYWALGWMVLMPVAAGDDVTLWAIGALRIAVPGAALIALAILAPVLHGITLIALGPPFAPSSR